MIKKIVVTIDGIDYELPEEITVSHYAELMRRMSYSQTDFEKSVDLITVLLGIPYQTIIQFEPEKLYELTAYLQEKLESCNIEFQKSFKWRGVEYGALNLNKMTFGEYIDIANYMKSDKYIYININKICAVLYRPVISNKKNKVVIAPYDLEQQEELAELFVDLPVKYFFGVINNLFNYVNQIKKDFNVLFDELKLDVPERKKDKNSEDEDSNLPWYKMIMALVDDDFTKINYATARPVVECFNHLTYITIKNAELKQQRLEMENKNRVL